MATTSGDDLRAVLRVSARADYAIRMVVAMAVRPEVVLAREYLAHSEGLPVKFVDHVLRQLRNGGLIESKRGRHGGYRLARPAEEISLADVVHAMAEPAPVAAAPRELPVPVPVSGWLADVWAGVSDAVDAALADISVAALRDARLAEVDGRGADGQGA
jgi:Rrf2 family protein